jgi:hypothetical protein
MLKATKLTLAAALLAGSCGLAMAQTGGTSSGAGGDKALSSTGADKNPTAGTAKVGRVKKNTGTPTATKDLGQETGTAKDTAGTSQMREESKKEKLGAGKGMKQKNTGMPTPTKDLGQETGTAKDTAGTSQMREESKKEQQKR